MRGGHNAKTRAQHRAAGTERKHRHSGYRNPEPPAGVPTMPCALEGDALAEWHRMIARLTSAQTLTIVDDALLYQYCQLFAETEDIVRVQQETAESARILQENFDRQGDDDLTFDDLLKAAQEIVKLRKLEAGYITKVRQGRMALRMMLTEFGLTPASRGRVRLPEAPEEPGDAFVQLQQQTKPGLHLAVRR